MRRVLTDYARGANRVKRGGGARRVSLSDAPVEGEPGHEEVELLDLHDALEALEAFSPRVARVVELRFLGGMSVEEAARELGVTERSVYRDWRVGRAALRRQLLGEDGA